MKIIIPIILAALAASSAIAEEISIELGGINEGRKDYSEQLIAKFWQTLDENAELRTAFEKYSEVARERRSKSELA